MALLDAQEATIPRTIQAWVDRVVAEGASDDAPGSIGAPGRATVLRKAVKMKAGGVQKLAAAKPKKGGKKKE